MDGMRDFPPDFAEPFVISFNYFKACNVRFFDDSAPFWRKYWRFFIMVVVVFFNFMSMLMYMFRVLGSKSIVDMAFLTASCLVGIQSILKAIVTLPKKKDIENLIRGLAKMWKTENLSDIQIAGKNRRLKQLNIGLTVFYWGATVAIIQNLSPQLIYTVFGKINQQDFDFILPYGYVYPFDPLKNWGRYLLVYFLQCYSIFQLINYYLGTQCLIVALCSQLSTEFAVLREDMKHAIPVPNKNKTQELSVDKNMTIESMISIHQKLIKLARLLNYIFNRMVFIDLCFFAAIVCFFAISFSLSHDTIDKIVSIVSIIMLLIMIYLFCYYCEMLKEESAGIAEAAYENPWYEGGTHYQKTIRFIIMRAQHPCCVTSLNYSPISLNTFTKVVSTTWSYFSLAMTVCGND